MGAVLRSPEFPVFCDTSTYCSSPRTITTALIDCRFDPPAQLGNRPYRLQGNFLTSTVLESLFLNSHVGTSIHHMRNFRNLPL